MDRLEKLKSIFADMFGEDIDLDKVNESSKFVEDLGMNSIGLLSMAMDIEQEFDIKFCNEDFENLRTVGDVIKCIENKKQNKKC